MAESPSPVDIDKVIDSNSLSGLQKRTIGLCLVIAILDGFDALSIGFVAPAAAKEWDMPVSGFAIVFALGLLGMMIGGLVLGPAADKFGRRKVILASTFVFSIFTLAAAFATSIEMLLVLRVLAGIGLGGITPNLIALASEYAPRRMRSTVATVVVCSISFGGFVGGLVAAWMIPEFGWRSVFLAGGILPLVILLISLKWLPESLKFLAVSGSEQAKQQIIETLDAGSAVEVQQITVKTETVKRSPVVTLFTDGRATNTLLLWAVFFFNLLVLYFLVNWMPAIFNAAGFTAGVALVASAIYQLGGVVGGLSIGLLTDRIGKPFRTIGCAYIIGAIAIAVAAQAVNSSLLLIVAVFLVGVGVTGSQTGISAVAAVTYPTSARATGIGWAYSIGRIGSIIGPSLGGYFLASGIAPLTIFSMTIVPTLIAAVAITVLGIRRSRAPEADQDAGESASPVGSRRVASGS